MLCMKFGIGLKPLVWGTVLMLLEVRNEIVEDVDEVILKTIVAD